VGAPPCEQFVKGGQSVGQPIRLDKRFENSKVSRDPKKKNADANSIRVSIP
jgi:hypothetical protein